MTTSPLAAPLPVPDAPLPGFDDVLAETHRLGRRCADAMKTNPMGSAFLRALRRTPHVAPLNSGF